MKSKKLEQIEEIYHAALEVLPSERSAFLAKSCGTDENLRREVESLLSFEDSSDKFLDKPPESFVAKMFAENDHHTNLTGTEISHYKIIKLLGKGGMGEVYLSEDTKLDRKVALKILPQEFSQNANRMRSRFVREAKSASALNHPHIAHIYEIGEAKDVNFIAMEFVEGVSLREKIHVEQVGLRTLLKYLAQVADGLAKAHQGGIVHRDLKPDNLMISGDGFAKILDFGLAKLIRLQNEEIQNNPKSEIPNPKLTQSGVIMGTVGYMSPEQARGQADIDARSDIFSFGCILYEAATRHQPFEGETMVDSLHKIIHTQPPPLKDFNVNVPVDLQRIVRRCLAKDPEDRYQTIKDVAIELKELRREMESNTDSEISLLPEINAVSRISQIGEQVITVGSVTQTNESIIHSSSSAEYLVKEAKKHKTGAGIVFALLALVAVGIGYGFYRLAMNQNASVLSFQTAKFTRLTTTGKASGVAISPDGKYVVHIQDEGGQQSLWTRQVATQSNVQIVAPKVVQYSGLTFSPDGNYIYYTAFSQELAQSVLFQVPPLGNVAPKKILENVATSPVSFSPDGKQFAFVRATPREEFMLMIANADGTEERIIAQSANPLESISSPAWSPDGKRIAYRLGNGESNDSSVFVAKIADNSTKSITTQRWLGIGGLTWLADGSGLLMLATSGQQFVNQVWYLSYPNGEARQITNDLNNYLGMSLAADSNNLAVVQSQQQASISVAPISDSNRLRPVTSGSGKSDLALVWTPDGRIVYQSNAGGNNIWITNTDGSNAKQLTANGRINLLPEVAPDGRSIVFLSYRTGVPHLWRMNIDGSDQRQLTNGASGEAGARFSPDGRWLIYRTALGRWTLWKMPVNGSGEPVQITDKYSRSPEFSPNGKFLAYFSREDNAPWRITVAPFEGSEPIKTFDISALPNPGLRWTPDGRAIAYVDTRNGVSNIVAQSLDGGKPTQLTDFTQERIFSFDYSFDGKQIALSRGTINNDVVLISNFK